MAKKQKYYVVWQGRKPGIYSSWDECKSQIEGISGAQYKSFATLAEAEQALRLPYRSVVDYHSPSHPATQSVLIADADGIVHLKPGIENPPELDAIAVDAACSGNPGVMEYQGIYIPSNTRLFHFRTECGTNNIGEFLAIVHGLAFLKQKQMPQLLYTDSRTALSWVRQKLCKSQLPLGPKTAQLWAIIHRAENWLRTNTYSTEIRKWDTDNWGEIPADFGRK